MCEWQEANAVRSRLARGSEARNAGGEAPNAGGEAPNAGGEGPPCRQAVVVVVPPPFECSEKRECTSRRLVLRASALACLGLLVNL